MSIEQIRQSVITALLGDEKLSAPEHCRYAVGELLRIARAADKTPPLTTISILVYPKASPGQNVHYCLRVSNTEEGTHIINTVSTAGFPEYNGLIDQAPGFFSQMKETDTIV